MAAVVIGRFIAGMRPLVRRGLFGILFLAVIAFTLAAWYVYHRGFSRSWRQQVAGEFRRRGLQISLRRLTFDPLRGLVAQEVKIVDDQAHVLAMIDQVVLEINYANLLAGEPFLDAVDLRDANLALPIDPHAAPTGDRLTVSQLNARFILPPHQIYLNHAEALCCGIQVSAQGRLANADSAHASPADPDQKQRRIALLRATVAELAQLKFAGEPPRLELQFSGDLAQPQSLFLEASLHMVDVRRGPTRLDQLTALADYRDQLVTIRQIRASDQAGTLEASGEFVPERGELRGQLRSTLDLSGLLPAFPILARFHDVAFHDPPRVEISGTWGAQTALTGHLATGKFNLGPVAFEKLESDFAWRDGSWFVHDFHLVHRSGTLRLEAMHEPDHFRGQIESSLAPFALLPWFAGNLIDPKLAGWDFLQPPHLTVRWDGSGAPAAAWEPVGHVQLGRSLFRGLPIVNGDAEFAWRAGVLSVTKASVATETGDGVGGFECDLGKNQTRITTATLRLPPATLVSLLNPAWLPALARWEFAPPPEITLSGQIPFSPELPATLRGTIRAPLGAQLSWAETRLPLPEASANFSINGDRIAISDATAWKGALTAQAAASSRDFSATLHARDLALAPLLQAWFPTNEFAGKLDGTWKISGAGDHSETWRGEGAIKVTGGDLFTLPLFTTLKAKAPPALASATELRALTAALKLANGTVQLEKISAQTSRWTMSGQGNWNPASDHLAVRLNLEALGVHLMDFAADGPLAHPAWQIKEP